MASALPWRDWLHLARAKARSDGPWRAKLPLIVATLGLAYVAVGGVLEKLGHPGATLDDAFIHFQYARAFAEGHPLRYQAGEPISTGATSLLWPLALAPFYLVGFRDLAILWPAWGLSFLALALLALEIHKLARPLAGDAPAIGAGAMVLAFSGYAWGAASGMESLPFAWAIARTVRLAAEWSEGERDHGALRRLTLTAWAALLLRPEGGIFALLAALTVVVWPRRRGVLGRVEALLPLAAPVAVTLALRLVSGSALSSTAKVKLLYGNPYYEGPALVAAVRSNVQLFFETLLDGKIWAAEFLPAGGTLVALGGLGAALAMGVRLRRPWRAVRVVALAPGMLVPGTYATVLWNRLRYLWPFASGWFVGLACFARLAGDALAQLRPKFQIAMTLLSGAFVGLLASRMSGTLEDVANSASGIDRQQVALGRWAGENLPPDARIGVNDTGAIAYFSGRKTFDVVGLTTPGEGRYWVAGAGSRFEHYERVHARAPESLPTHFIVYPEWMACDAVLGAPLHEAVVTDASILGGRDARLRRRLPQARIGRASVDVGARRLARRAGRRRSRERGRPPLRSRRGARGGERGARRRRPRWSPRRRWRAHPPARRALRRPVTPSRACPRHRPRRDPLRRHPPREGRGLRPPAARPPGQRRLDGDRVRRPRGRGARRDALRPRELHPHRGLRVLVLRPPRLIVRRTARRPPRAARTLERTVGTTRAATVQASITVMVSFAV